MAKRLDNGFSNPYCLPSAHDSPAVQTPLLLETATYGSCRTSTANLAGHPGNVGC